MDHLMKNPKMVNGEMWINGVNITWHEQQYAAVRAESLAAGFEHDLGSFDDDADFVAEMTMTARQKTLGHKCVALLDAANRLRKTCSDIAA